MGSLLAIATHPDDESYSFAATVAAAVLAGWQTALLCVSDGERGKRHDGGTTGPSEVRDVRRREFETSARTLGTSEVRFLGIPDGAVDGGPGLASIFREAARAAAADLVLAPGADGAYGHPDHVAVYRAAIAGLGGAGERPQLALSCFPRGLFAAQWHRCRSMLGNPPAPPLDALGATRAHYELRSLGLAEVKRRALSCHRSQLPGGDPERLFPSGIVRGLIAVERFIDGRGDPNTRVSHWFADFQSAATSFRTYS